MLATYTQQPYLRQHLHNRESSVAQCLRLNSTAELSREILVVCVEQSNQLATQCTPQGAIHARKDTRTPQAQVRALLAMQK